MDDVKSVVKELHRIADAGERIAKALEKYTKSTNHSLSHVTGTERPPAEEA